MSLRTEKLNFSYRGSSVLRDVSFFLPDRSCLAVLGPNGVGKTTLLKLLIGSMRPQSGDIYINEKNVRDYNPSDFAAQIAYIPQNISPSFNYTVLESVIMGQNRYLGPFSRPSRADREEALALLESLDIRHLADKGIQNISGGELQLVKIARALIQKSDIIIMDEPCANLDYGNTSLVLRMIRLLCERGFSIIFTTHDPNHALLCATHVMTLQYGAVCSFGVPEAVINTKNMSTLYHTPVDVTQALVGGEVRTVCTIAGGLYEK